VWKRRNGKRLNKLAKETLKEFNDVVKFVYIQ